jgi:carboxylesterase type B
LFHDFATDAGCPVTGAVLDCLRSKDSLTLQYANSNISISQTYGTWAFLPVTDYSFIESLPSVALHGKRVNGRNILVGNNANEGALLVPQNISTLDGLKAWMRLSYPTLKGADIEKVLDVYHSTDAPDNPNSPKFATNGLEGATAVNVSQVATGHQQRANVRNSSTDIYV